MSDYEVGLNLLNSTGASFLKVCFDGRNRALLVMGNADNLPVVG